MILATGDTDDTTRMWNLISQNRNKELKAWIDEDPDVVHIRSSDGKGPISGHTSTATRSLSACCLSSHETSAARGTISAARQRGQSEELRPTVICCENDDIISTINYL